MNDMTTILIRLYADSYMYVEPMMDHYFDQQDFDQIKRKVEDRLRDDKSKSNAPTETFWCTFNEWNGETWDETEEMFKHRIKV